MKYQFNEIPNRRGTECVKWDIFPEGDLALWVADMDFAVCPKIISAMQKRMEHPVFGYALEGAEFMPRQYGSAMPVSPASSP